ncbi:L-lactate permease, partial [Klebsiella aerogenes]|uniref:L-lactate permease n=1 Tax=Klebsiella aerogenes TaxID=548 RepID=UPI001952A41E
IGLFSFPIPGLHDTIVLSEANKLLPQVFKFNFLSASGTAILLAAVASLPLLGLGFKDGLKTFLHTLVQLKIPIVTIAAVLGFAYILN